MMSWTSSLENRERKMKNPSLSKLFFTSSVTRKFLVNGSSEITCKQFQIWNIFGDILYRYCDILPQQSPRAILVPIQVQLLVVAQLPLQQGRTQEGLWSGSFSLKLGFWSRKLNSNLLKSFFLFRIICCSLTRAPFYTHV